MHTPHIFTILGIASIANVVSGSIATSPAIVSNSAVVPSTASSDHVPSTFVISSTQVAYSSMTSGIALNVSSSISTPLYLNNSSSVVLSSTPMVSTSIATPSSTPLPKYDSRPAPEFTGCTTGFFWSNEEYKGTPKLLHAIKECIHVHLNDTIVALRLNKKVRCTFFADHTCDKTKGEVSIHDGPGDNLVSWRVRKTKANSYLCEDRPTWRTTT